MRRLLLAVTALAVAATACSSPTGQQPSSTIRTGLNIQPHVGPFQGFGMQVPQPRPQFTLTDTHGKRYDFGKQTQGKPTFLFFGYTHCPDVCPATMADIGATLRTLPASISRQVVVVFVTTDVSRDTGPVIATWLSHFSAGTKGATFVGLRGTRAQVNVAQAASHIPLASDGGLTHSAQVLLYGPDNYARVSFAATNQERQEMTHDLPIVVKERAAG